MLTQIEENVAARLDEKLEKPKRVTIDEAHGQTALAMPAIDVVCGGGPFAKAAQSWKLQLTVYVIVTFQNLRSVRDRRKGVYPILLAVLGWLTGEKLGLPIERLKPARLDNITNKEEAEEGKIVFQLSFETAFVFEKLSDEDVGEILEIALNYYLKPGDDEVDAMDIVRVGP